jgi:hypothetical protein
MGTFATSWTTGDTIPATELNTLSGAWTTYTPTVGGTGWALGNGTVAGRYKKVGRVVVCRVQVTWGTTSTYGAGQLTVSTPVTPANDTPAGLAQLNDGGTDYIGWCNATTGGVFFVYSMNTAGTYLVNSSVVSTVPFTWTTSDYVRLSAVYESAS